MIVKKCKICGKEFLGNNHQRCCSPKCTKENGRRMSANWKGLRKDQTPIFKTCKICGKEFQAHKHTQRCCSAECSKKNKRSRDVNSQEHSFRTSVARRAKKNKAARDIRLSRRDLEHAALHIPVKVTERDGFRIESRGLCPGGWQGRGKLITHP